ncbi:MAG: ABC transporter ATP-binding protein [Rhizobiales bacterium]|nr:ABC transporter ATP-binding protein [Hyphomicrobiales bacterium]
MTAIVLDHVSRDFEIERKAVRAIDDISLTFPSGSFSALIGPSGCGKSTLLRLVADVLAPTAGAISIGGLPPGEARRKHEIGFVFQDASLLPWRSVIDNIALPLEIAGGPVGEGARPENLVRLVGLSGFENARPAQLSGGMQQRVSIARALTLRPKVLLLDEPFGALDEITRQRMNLELLRIWQETGTTAILVTHTIGEAVFMADQVHVLAAHPGRLVTTIDVDLPRPRSLAMLQSAAFNRLENAVRAALFGDELAQAAPREAAHG